MEDLVKLFNEIGEPYAAGLFEDPGRGDFYRFAKAFRRFYEARPVNPYRGGRLYPSGLDERGDACVQPDCAKTFNPATGGKGTLKGFYEPLSAKSKHAAEVMLAFREEHNFTVTPSDEAITISGYTHCIPHYERVIAEGLDSYIPRIEKIEDRDMRDGLLELVAGLRGYHARCLEELRTQSADPELVEALEQVPFAPARSAYQALVCWNFIFFLDSTDNLGWIDHGLMPYWKGEDLRPELHELFQSVCVNDGWSCTIGPDYTPLTKQCLEAVRGLYRPMMQLRLSPDLPDEAWGLVCETVYSGGGQPSFYNEDKTQEMLRAAYPDAPAEDLERFACAGCTETHVAGYSNTGGIDANLNLAMVFERYLRCHLAECSSYEDFYAGYCAEVKRMAKLLIEDVRRNHKRRAEHLPQPLRSLLVDDCIDRGLDFNAGGARYNAALTAESGMINVIDSLLAVKRLVFEEHRYAPEEFLALLAQEDGGLLAQIKRCPCFGTDEDEPNELAHEFSNMYYSCFEGEECFRGGPYTPSSHQFNRHGKEGKKVGPTPDGRRGGTALCDSVAPLSGKATKGPTAALLSSAHLAQEKIWGIPVYNLTVHRKYPAAILKALIQGYFAAGGVQVQITVTSAEELADALEHPERHEDLVIRVGGYTEYFNRLTPELQRSVYERTVFESR